MQLTNRGAEIFVPDGAPPEDALARTTEMGIGAHQDDLELMSYMGILKCIGSWTDRYTGVVVTDGGGSPRDGIYADYSDEDMRKIRRVEQKQAAVIGQYSAQVLLDFPSSAVKNPHDTDVVGDLKKLLEAAGPGVVYTHNLADKHDTHVAVALRVIQAIRELPADNQPKAVYGCEVWRDLDWLPDEDKVAFDVGAREDIAEALLGAFDSQISGGKRYDLAAMGRRRAHATFYASHGTDVSTGMIFAMDLTPLVADPSLQIAEYVEACIRTFSREVTSTIARLS